MLSKNPKSGRACSSIKPGYWRAREGRHVIFYVFSNQTLDVIRILHERMLPERHW
jgi:toxin ParE1/3/4